jgi:hypothetical protein
LIAYVRQQQPNDRATIRQQMIVAGHPPELIEQALERVYGAAPVSNSQLEQRPVAQAVSVERMRAYLEQHKQTYTQEALRRKLIEDGHNPETVDLAIAQAYGFQVSGTPPLPEYDRRTVALISAGVFLFNYAVWTVAVIFTVQGSGPGFGVIPALLIPETVAAVVLRRRNLSVARGLAWGIGVSLLPIILLALLFGICLVVIGGLYGF